MEDSDVHATRGTSVSFIVCFIHRVFTPLGALVINEDEREWKLTSLQRLIQLADHCSTVFDKTRIFHYDLRQPNVVVDGDRVKFIDWDFAQISEMRWREYVSTYDNLLQFIRCAGPDSRELDKWNEWEFYLHTELGQATCFKDVQKRLSLIIFVWYYCL
eukprot:GHVR01059574.1.p1 GENE.GHVR01059574.1~~GHVR01059574.1.p1  ORF type:complete len:159 (+),score=17.73 GHVR01059574.1:741-1217(+)